MGVIAKYKFNQNVYENFIPEFNSGFTYTVTDEVDTDGYTIRTIESNSLPTLMRFGVRAQTNREKSLLEVYECNTSNVTNMDAMFFNCSSLTSLDVSNFNTSQVVNMNSMFYNCKSLTSLDLSNFNTSQVANMYGMFRDCSSLTSLDVSNFDTSEVNNMQFMFQGCSSLTSLDVSNFNTSQVANMYGMFQDCSSLTSLDTSNFNTKNVTDMSYMFRYCSSLTFLDVSNFNTSQVSNMSQMFYGCSSLASLDVSNFNTEKVTNMGQMFQNCSKLTSLDLSNWSTNSLTNIGQMFFGCLNLEFLDISNFNINDNVGVSSLFVSCSNVSNIGMIYCNSSAINKISDSITTNTTIWYQDANISDLTVKDNITYKKYQSTTLSLNEPIQLRSIGDVHDEINYETGEYIQRIGECIYEDDLTPIYSSQIGGYTDSMEVKGKIGLVVADGMGAISDKLINQGFTNYDCGIYGNLNGYLYIFDKTVKSGEEFINKYRGTKFQFILLEPIITKIDTTILDQNSSYKSSQQTYDEQTYVSVQSDTVVTPSSSVDYEIYSSTGTVTGTSASIENAEAGTPISGVVYGETLLNVIQEPSETEYVITGEAFEEQSGTLENTVEGNIKSAILKGQTLVNLLDMNNLNQQNSITYGVPLTTAKSEITIIATTKTANKSPRVAIFTEGGKWVGNVDTSFTNNKIHYKAESGQYVKELVFTTDNIASHSYSYESLEQFREQGFIVIEGNYKKDVPSYFEGMQSVKMPVLTTVGKNLAYLEQGYIDSENGNDAPHEYSIRTNYIAIDPQLRYSIYGLNKEASFFVAYYDNHKNFISRTKGSKKEEISLTPSSIPTNACYIRLTNYGSDNNPVTLDTPIMVEQGNRTSYEPYKTNILTVNEDVTLRSNGDVYDELNLLTGRLTQRIDENNEVLAQEVVKTVSTTILDQDDNTTDNLHTFDTTTHINTYAQGGGLIPFVNIPENISYDTILKENTQYTIKLNRTNIVEGTPLTVNLGGTELSIEDNADSFAITTPSTLVNNTLSIGGANNEVKEVMVIEGDYVDRDLDFFEGFISVENPIVQIYNDNMWGKLILPPATIESFEADYQSYITTKKPILFLKPNTRYIVNANITTKEQIVTDFQEKTENGTNRLLFGFNITGTGRIASYFDTTNGEVYLNFYPGYNDEDIKMVFDLLEQTDFTICEYTKYGNNINTVIEKKSNTLTTYPQITLRSIGDIKDEWDVVSETVTRRIGEVVLDGSEDWKFVNGGASHGYYWYGNADILNIGSTVTALKNIKVYCNHLQFKGYSSSLTMSVGQIQVTTIRGIVVSVPYNNTVLKEKLRQNPIIIYIEADVPITESVRITPPNPQTSTASITIPTQLNHVEDTSDFLVWNPYKEHYVRYNYVEDGVVLDNYTWENLTDLNERQFVEFYNRRTYVYQPYHNYVASHDSKGTSKYVLIEPNQDYTVSVRFSELPICETVKVNLGGAEVEMNVNDPHVHVTTPNTLVNNLCSISGDGLDGKVTDILVIHCLEHEGFADIDYFEGIDGIGEIVEVEGVPKSKIVMEQTNGNLLPFLQDSMSNNGNNIGSPNNSIRPNKQYVFKIESQAPNANGGSYFRIYSKDGKLLNGTYGQSIGNSNDEMGKPKVIKVETPYNASYYNYYKVMTADGSANKHYHAELCYADMEKDYIRPRYNDKEEIILPIQLHRINTVYDNFYYDEMKGYYRIQQSIGHKYFIGADSENWTLIERGQRVLRFRYNNADIQIKSLGEFMTNILPNGNATSPYECCAFNGINFIVSIDKERLSSESLTAFKEWLANNNLHLYYQLASPLMIDLPEYSSRIEFNTYKDEIYTFFKNCKPTVFTLAVPLDQTYRFYELEQGEGYANRVELTEERMTEEDKLYVHTIYGSGISNLIEEPNNVDTMLKPNYEGKATSHSLTNGKVSTIGIHGFEPNNATISNYNTITKQYELTVQAKKGTNTNTETLAVPYKLEIYEDGTKDRVYYSSQYKQWMFEGGQTLTVPYNTSTGAFTNVVEVFRGLQPRSGLIGEFKVKFASGTTSARLYYSINGTTYGYTTLRGMTDEVDYYIGFFNTGGTKIDMGTKIDANAEYTTLVPINGTIPECLMINQIQSITECTYYQDKTYYYSDVVSPLVLDVYNGETIITELNGAVIDIQNNAHNKQALIYGDTTYTVYWTYVGGEGNIKVTLGGVTQEVVATQGYATITTSDKDLERGLFIGGFNVTIKDLMLVKGERIENLKYFEGSRAVGTAFTDENGETMYKITLVTGSELINDKFEDMITFEDNKKHNVVVTKLLGAKPDKI